MAEYKQVDLQIGTEAQFESKKEALPIGTIVGITDPIHKSDLDSDLQTSIDSIADKLDKPSGNPTEDSLVKVSSTGAVSWARLKTLFGNHSLLGEGNIDLYKHNIKGVSGNSTFYLRLYSSKNLKVNTLTDLKTLLGNTFEESCTGSNGIMAITQDNVLFDDGTTASISGYTITDDVKTI